ncbi:MAG: DNA translocase FtsK [Clostridia bacterium]|nr:DNA translocase FtsK [Clostridia bacterium]
MLKTYAKSSNNSIEYFEKNKKIIEETLANFNVSVTVESSTRGAAFTRFELKMAPGVPVASVKKYEDDIAMNLEALSMRMEAPIPGKNLVGIEIPRPSDDRDIIGLRQVFEDSDFFTKNRSLAFALGTNIAGESIIGDLEKMPHLLISGGTGSGKSICMNTIICSLLYKYSPEYVRFILVDPKQVEFNIYNDLPHLLVKEVISDTEKAINALNWAIKEMEQRYTLFKTTRCKNISDYNTFIENDKTKPRMPYIVFIIDELADLMSTKKKDVEDKVQRLAQKARAAGILLILATQRPSVDIISGVIKTNLPSRIALSLSNYQDSKTILDRGGAEKLLGNGDMLYFPMGMMDPVRLQGAYLSNSEIASITEYVCTHNESYYDNAIDDAINTVNTPEVESASEAAGPQYVTPAGGAAQDMDFLRALRFCVENKKASISSIQSALALGFPKASRYIMMMERKGYISVGNNSSKPRDVYMTLDQFIEQFGDVGQIEI